MRFFLSMLCLLLTVFISGQPVEKGNVPTSFEAFQKMQNEKFAGKEYPRFFIKLPDASSFSNTDLTDHTVFINFWFEACAPCMAEMEGLNELYAKLAGNPNFKFVSFSFDPDSTIQRLVEQLNIKYKVIHLDKAECYRLNFQSGFPSSFILDKKGKISYYKMGGVLDKEKATKAIMTEIYPKITALL